MKLLYNTQTSEIIHEQDFRQQNQNLILPEDIYSVDLSEYNLVPFTYDNVQPENPWDIVVEGDVVVTENSAHKHFSIQFNENFDFELYIPSVRFQKEISGCKVLGHWFHTDREARALITDAGMWAALNPEQGRKWKTMDGFVDFTGEQLLQIAVGVNTHAQLCFNREDELIAHVRAGTFELEMLEEGWPTYE